MNRFILFCLAAMVGLPTAIDAQARPGSIYNVDHGPTNMIADKKATRPGDLLTVIISESQDVQNTESSDLQRSDTLAYELNSFDLKPNLFNPLPGIESSSAESFKGTANYKKQGSLEARITVLVVDTLPNGNLVINGRREIRIDQETKVIAFTGVVRRYDITANNTVESELVANAKVSYIGEGPLTKSTNRWGLGSLIRGFLTWIWPF